MNQRTLSIKQLAAYDASLRTDERAPGTLEKYLRDLRAFLVWLDGRPVTKELAHQWKEELQTRGYAPGHDQLHAVRAQRPVPGSWAGRSAGSNF